MYVPWQVVIASCDVEERRAMCNILAKQGLDPIPASTVRECSKIMDQESVGLIFCAHSLVDGDYRDLLLVVRVGGCKIPSRPHDSPARIAMNIWKRCGWAPLTSSRLPAARPTWNGWSFRRYATSTPERGRSPLHNESPEVFRARACPGQLEVLHGNASHEYISGARWIA